MIRIICGSCGTSQGCKTAADGVLSLPEAEEARLVARKVAEYVTDRKVSTCETAKWPGINETEKDEKDKPEKENAAESVSTAEKGTAACPDEALLRSMKLADLKKLAASLGIDASGMKSKAAVASAIAAVSGSGAGGCELPTLDAEGPVL